MKKLFLPFLLLTLVFSQTSAFSAQKKPADAAEEPKNDLMISVAGYEDLRNAILLVAKKMNPLFEMETAAAMNPANNPMIPKGIAKTGPLGVVMRIDEDGNTPDEIFGNLLAFAPVTKSFDASTLEAMLGEMTGGTASVKVAGGHAVATLPTTKITLPADPATLLGPLPTRYLAAVQVNPSKYAHQLETLDPATRIMVSMMLPADPTEFMKQIDGFLLGANVDSSTGDVSLELTTRALAGTEIADELKNRKKVATKLARFYDPEASIAMHAAIVLPEGIKEAVEDMLGRVPEDDMPTLMRVLFQQVLEAGKLDVAFSGYVGGERKKGIAAFAIQDGPALAQAILDDIRDKKNPNRTFVSAKFNVAEAMPNVWIHTLVPPKEMQGATVAVAMTNTYFFVAFNYDDNVAVLKEKITATLKAPAPAADFQGIFTAELDEDLENVSGSLTFAGSFTATGLKMKAVVTPDFIMAQILSAQQSQVRAQREYEEWEERRDLISDAYDETDIPRSYWISGNTMTVTVPKNAPQEEVDALLEKLEKILPNLKMKVETAEYEYTPRQEQDFDNPMVRRMVARMAVNDAFRRFDGQGDYDVSEDEITLYLAEDTPQAEKDALIERVKKNLKKEKLPEMNIEIEPYEPDPQWEAFNEVYTTTEGLTGYGISGDAITLDISKDMPAAKVKALVEKVKEIFPEMDVTTKVQGE